jgi:hypothetical protein
LGFAAQWLFCSLTIGKKHNKEVLMATRCARGAGFARFGKAGGRDAYVTRWVRVVIASNNLFKWFSKDKTQAGRASAAPADLALG